MHFKICSQQNGVYKAFYTCSPICSTILPEFVLEKMFLETSEQRRAMRSAGLPHWQPSDVFLFDSGFWVFALISDIEVQEEGRRVTVELNDGRKEQKMSLQAPEGFWTAVDDVLKHTDDANESGKTTQESEILRRAAQTTASDAYRRFLLPNIKAKLGALTYYMWSLRSKIETDDKARHDWLFVELPTALGYQSLIPGGLVDIVDFALICDAYGILEEDYEDIRSSDYNTAQKIWVIYLLAEETKSLEYQYRTLRGISPQRRSSKENIRLSSQKTDLSSRLRHYFGARLKPKSPASVDLLKKALLQWKRLRDLGMEHPAHPAGNTSEGKAADDMPMAELESPTRCHTPDFLTDSGELNMGDIAQDEVAQVIYKTCSQ